MLGQGKVGLLNSLTIAQSPTTAVSGTLVVPAVFFAYANTDSTLFMTDTAQYTTALFSSSPPGGNPYTLRTFYEQMSNNALSLTGRILGWVRLANPEVTYTGVAGTCSGNPFGTSNCNGIFSGAAISGMQGGFREALAAVDNQVDFGQFDNDGPDGIPNSGDDDGYVDMIMFAHPTKDGACGGFPGGADPATNNHIWSHRYTLLTSYVTNDPAHAGNTSGFSMIHVADYFATSARGGANACDTTQIMPIGTAAHEFGHALLLPDLYDTQGNTEGIGQWGLMGSGNFTSPRSPSRMEAWSLNELGWVTLQQLTSSGTYALDPAATARTAAYIRPPGPNPRAESFLVENRQGGPAGLADSAVIRRHCQTSFQPVSCPGGLLIWHVDASKIAASGFHQSNTVNSGSIHGLVLEEADGLRQLWCASAGCNRGDAGDPYLGVSGNTAFVYRTNPVATMTDGSFAGFGIDQITQVVPDGQMSFRLKFGSLTVVRASDTTATIRFDAANYFAFRDLLDDGSSHNVGFVDGQVVGRTRFNFQSWSDAGAINHPITGSLAGGTLTASLLRHHPGRHRDRSHERHVHSRRPSRDAHRHARFRGTVRRLVGGYGHHQHGRRTADGAAVHAHRDVRNAGDFQRRRTSQWRDGSRVRRYAAQQRRHGNQQLGRHERRLASRSDSRRTDRDRRGIPAPNRQLHLHGDGHVGRAKPGEDLYDVRDRAVTRDRRRHDAAPRADRAAHRRSASLSRFLAWVKSTGAPLSAAMIQVLQRKGGPR